MTNSFLKYWAPFYIYAAFIFYLSSIPKPLPEVGIPFFDKMLHICEYAVFAILAARAFKNSSRRILFSNFKILAILVSILYGVSDEFHQAFISEREASLLDVAADGIGGMLGALIYGRYYFF